MAITKMSNSGIASTGSEKYNDMLAGNPPFFPVGFDSIATLTAVGGETSMTFSSIPQSYKSLHLRIWARRPSGSAFQVGIRFNGDTGSTNYSYLYALGMSNGSVSYSGNNTASFIWGLQQATASNASGIYGGGIYEIDNYTSTTKNKAVQAIGGFNTNSGADIGYITYSTGNWYNTAAITSLTMFSQGDTYAAGTTFALYGVL
jgi:hypothetical protein